MTIGADPRPSEIPEALRPFAARFAQRAARVIYHHAEDREVRQELLRWPVIGLEFADATIARTADFRHFTFALHHFESWNAGEAWLAGEGGHDSWAECPGCSEIRALYDKWAAEDYE